MTVPARFCYKAQLFESPADDFIFRERHFRRRKERKMICQTIKAGTECGLMTKKGCGFKGGACLPIVEACEGCAKVAEYAAGKYCKVYPEPAVKWLSGRCPTATHVKIEVKEAAQKINPLKASKRASKK